MRQITTDELRQMAADAREEIWEIAAANGREPKVYLHWSAGHYGQFFDDYHVNIDADGTMYASTDDLSEVLAHTWKRNSGAVGISLACCAGANTRRLGDEPPTAEQIEVMARAIAAICEGLWLTIDKAHVLTHGEAADNEDGIEPHEPYGPKNGCDRWDLEYLHTEESPRFDPHATDGTRGGDVLRGKANWYYNQSAEEAESHEGAETTRQEPDNTDNIEVIATLARKYESSGDPAAVSSGAGDLGGISYGLYQLASNVSSVHEFLAWLSDYPVPELANYGKTLAKQPVNSAEFIQTWREIGTADPGNFGRLQDEYIISRYYDVAAGRLIEEMYHIDRHTDAIKAVLLSRAVQHGPAGAVELFEESARLLGHPNLSYVDDAYFDRAMIEAIYDFLIAECDTAHQDTSGIMHSPDGFCNGSRGVISGLRSRFVREKADALELLEAA